MKTFPHRLALATAVATVIASVMAASFIAPSSANAATPAPRVIQLPTVVVVAKRTPVVQLERVVVVAKRPAAASTFVVDRTLPVAVPKAAAPV